MIKYYHFSLLLLLITGYSHAQNNDYVPKSEDWIFYDLTYVMYANAPQGVDMNAWPSGHSLSLMKDWVLGTSHFSVAAGLGYTSNNYRSNVGVAEDFGTGEAEFYLLDDHNYDKNKINTKYIEIPLELRFRSKPDMRENFFRFYVGVRGGVRIGGYSQYKRDNLDVRFHKLEELNRWRLGAYTRIGYSHFSLYGYYGLLDIFNYDHEGSDLLNMNGTRSLALGISFSF